MSAQDDARRELERQMALDEARRVSEDGKKPGITLEGAVRAGVSKAATAAVKSGGAIAVGVINGLADAGRGLNGDRSAEDGHSPGAASKFTRFSSSAANSFFGKMWSRLDPAAEWVIRLARKNTPRLAHALAWTADKMAFRKDEKGGKNFDPKYLLMNTIKVGLVGTAAMYGIPILAVGSYYYLTLETHNGVFIPVSGVYANQQFVHPSKPGEVIAPRDEIFTVLGQYKEADGRLEPIRFDLDYNGYFAYPYDLGSLVGLNIPFGDAARPDLAASKLQPRSSYGALCDIQSTGIYNRIPRYFRYRLIRWIDLRPEIVNVKKCEQLTKPFDGIPVLPLKPEKQSSLGFTYGGLAMNRPAVKIDGRYLQLKAA